MEALGGGGGGGVGGPDLTLTGRVAPLGLLAPAAVQVLSLRAYSFIS